jgi:hypothetical protein
MLCEAQDYVKLSFYPLWIYLAFYPNSLIPANTTPHNSML